MLLLSPQFLLWLLPAAAILPEGARFDRVRTSALAASIATAVVIAVEVPIYDGDLYALVILVVRNLLLVALAGTAWAALRRAPESSECSSDLLPAASPTPLGPTSSRTQTAA